MSLVPVAFWQAEWLTLPSDAGCWVKWLVRTNRPAPVGRWEWFYSLRQRKGPHLPRCCPPSDGTSGLTEWYVRVIEAGRWALDADLPAAQSACRRFVAEKMNFGFLAIVCYGQWLPPPRAVFAGSSWRASMNAIAWLRRVRPLTLGRWRWARTEEGFSGRLVVVRPPVGFRHALTTCC